MATSHNAGGGGDLFERQAGLTYHPLAEDEIRILEWTPTIWRQEILRFSMRHVKKQRKQPYKTQSLFASEYIALSYCWGKSPPTQTIYVDGHPVQVTPTLWQALEQLVNRQDWNWTPEAAQQTVRDAVSPEYYPDLVAARTRTHSGSLHGPILPWKCHSARTSHEKDHEKEYPHDQMRFTESDGLPSWKDQYDALHACWVDAICINQRDLNEKAVQVGKMYTVYQGAAFICSWLGQPNREVRLLYETLLATEPYCTPAKSRGGCPGCNAYLDELSSNRSSQNCPRRREILSKLSKWSPMIDPLITGYTAWGADYDPRPSIGMDGYQSINPTDRSELGALRVLQSKAYCPPAYDASCYTNSIDKYVYNYRWRSDGDPAALQTLPRYCLAVVAMDVESSTSNVTYQVEEHWSPFVPHTNDKNGLDHLRRDVYWETQADLLARAPVSVAHWHQRQSPTSRPSIFLSERRAKPLVEIMDAVAHILAQPYFHRTWIVPEMARAMPIKNPSRHFDPNEEVNPGERGKPIPILNISKDSRHVMLWGDMAFSPEDFRHLVGCTGLRGLFNTPEYQQTWERFDRIFARADPKSHEDGGADALQYYLDKFRHTQCTDPRDRIFAMLSYPGLEPDRTDFNNFHYNVLNGESNGYVPAEFFKVCVDVDYTIPPEELLFVTLLWFEKELTPGESDRMTRKLYPMTPEEKIQFSRNAVYYNQQDLGPIGYRPPRRGFQLELLHSALQCLDLGSVVEALASQELQATDFDLDNRYLREAQGLCAMESCDRSHQDISLGTDLSKAHIGRCSDCFYMYCTAHERYKMRHDCWNLTRVQIERPATQTHGISREAFREWTLRTFDKHRFDRKRHQLRLSNGKLLDCTGPYMSFLLGPARKSAQSYHGFARFFRRIQPTHKQH